MSKNYENAKEFLEAMKKDWRTRYQYVTEEKFLDLDIKDNPRVIDKLINIAHFDPASVVRQEAVRTCNRLHILYKGKPVRLRKMRSLHNTLKALKVDIEDVCIQTLVKAQFTYFPRNKEMTSEEWERFYEVLKKDNFNIYDLLDGHFSTKDEYENRKVKNKAQVVVKRNKNSKMDKFLKDSIKYTPNVKVEKYFSEII